MFGLRCRYTRITLLGQFHLINIAHEYFDDYFNMGNVPNLIAIERMGHENGFKTTIYEYAIIYTSTISLFYHILYIADLK